MLAEEVKKYDARLGYVTRCFMSVVDDPVGGASVDHFRRSVQTGTIHHRGRKAR
jgi:hypothetical protein